MLWIKYGLNLYREEDIQGFEGNEDWEGRVEMTMNFRDGGSIDIGILKNDSLVNEFYLKVIESVYIDLRLLIWELNNNVGI